MNSQERVRAVGQWLALGTLVGLVCGAASAVFLWLLDQATEWRTGHEAIVYFLPVAGLALGWLAERFGQAIKAGNNLVIDTIHDDGPEIPLRMAPLVLLGTVLTHLFGGSAGREGTAVQMAASRTDWLSHRLRLGRSVRRQLLAASVAGGFGSVFGTPVAGAVFGLEFVVRGRIEYHALVPALVASVVGDLTTRGLGVPMIERAFTDPHLPVEAFVLKLLFTAVTLGAGFLGGEVTPLFFVGATLGNVLARPLGIPLELGAAVGLAALFAAAANTPLALSIMAVELFGAAVLPHVLIVCVVACVLSGHASIYPAQRLFRNDDIARPE